MVKLVLLMKVSDWRPGMFTAPGNGGSGCRFTTTSRVLVAALNAPIERMATLLFASVVSVSPAVLVVQWSWPRQHRRVLGPLSRGPVPEADGIRHGDLHPARLERRGLHLGLSHCLDDDRSDLALLDRGDGRRQHRAVAIQIGECQGGEVAGEDDGRGIDADLLPGEGPGAEGVDALLAS